ncbi:type II toxin-antitoxin system VapC family toxin [Candidatus Thiosymbion oneisti]|uniref:type II toxin-antitoxin system VapC family toxin n=1 Tax=Candidatus Thiosymbion oneisti TaxID=589554 RepID=UPI000B7F1689|nr:type II toxin-antitoxin system VapC family toxin [Candidatus Thiosymbion oneisti]
MKLVVDTSVVLAVLFNEPERDVILSVTKGCELLAPLSLPVEVGNAISLAFKKRRIDLGQGEAVIDGLSKMKIRFEGIDYINAITIAHKYSIYAYDAYMMDLAQRERCHLFSLDAKLKLMAKEAEIRILEV